MTPEEMIKYMKAVGASKLWVDGNRYTIEELLVHDELKEVLKHVNDVATQTVLKEDELQIKTISNLWYRFVDAYKDNYCFDIYLGDKRVGEARIWMHPDEAYYFIFASEGPLEEILPLPMIAKFLDGEDVEVEHALSKYEVRHVGGDDD